VETTGAFLNALKFQDNDEVNEVRGLKNGILVHNRDTGMLLHVLPKQNLLFKADSMCYFPNNNETEKKTQSVLGSSFVGAIKQREAILKG